MRLFAALLLLCAACAPDPALSDSLFIATAVQMDAPALASAGAGIAFVWAGFDEVDVHQDARLLNGDALTETVMLPLPPTHPFERHLIAGADGALHLLWLDAAQDGEGNRLYSALLGPDLRVQRGPVEVSNAPTYRYSAASDGQGGVWAVWSAGAAAEPALTLGRMDVLGRPLPPIALHRRGNFPALTARADGTLWLFWRSEGQLWRMALADNLQGDPDALSASVGLWPGDTLERLWAAPCATLVCVGWNITRADGQAESWLSAGRAAAEQWDPPKRLGGLAWLTPEAEARAGGSSLGAAAQTDDGLALVMLADGVAETMELAVPDVQLRGSPALLRAGGAWLFAWADCGSTSARLYVTRRGR